MNKEALIKFISQEIQSGRNVDLEYTINQIPYRIIIQKPDYENGINISSIIAIPMTKNIGRKIVLESNNLESGNFEQIINQGMVTGTRLVELTNNQPAVIIVPLIPSYKNAPYFQQLSKECFELQSKDRNYRLDEQVVRIIEKAKKTVKEVIGIDLEDKIFLNGYSSSGVFAQRFALLHPELISEACIGGASGSIPVPIENIGYPIGISDYTELTGKEFDMESYSEISFTYYVGELDDQDKSATRTDDNGDQAPMHDMSYFDRSIPLSVGKKQRELLGSKMFERIQKTMELLKSMGIQIEHIIIPGRAHNNKGGIGVNEIGDKIVKDTYDSSVTDSNPIRKI